jgi:hypothetical protein
VTVQTLARQTIKILMNTLEEFRISGLLHFRHWTHSDISLGGTGGIKSYGNNFCSPKQNLNVSPTEWETNMPPT